MHAGNRALKVGLFLALGLAGCLEAQEEAVVPLTDEQLRARTETIYPSVDMYKPVAGEGLEFDVYQAPMFYREDPESSPALYGDEEFAKLQLEDGEVALDVQSPTVYVHRGVAQHGAIAHDQTTFLWFGRTREGQPVQAQGLRMTYGSDGQPAIYEVLIDESGKSLFYVSEALEVLAKEQHGGALDGRSFSVELAAAEAVGTLVVRLVKQGPQPLGPLVYDGLAGSDIVQLHCRCSSSQLKAIGNSVDYELVAFESLDIELRQAVAKATGWGDSAADLGFPSPIWPFANLRLPDAF